MKEVVIYNNEKDKTTNASTYEPIERKYSVIIKFTARSYGTHGYQMHMFLNR